jgi:hypothetical protein
LIKKIKKAGRAAKVLHLSALIWYNIMAKRKQKKLKKYPIDYKGVKGKEV